MDGWRDSKETRGEWEEAVGFRPTPLKSPSESWMSCCFALLCLCLAWREKICRLSLILHIARIFTTDMFNNRSQCWGEDEYQRDYHSHRRYTSRIICVATLSLRSALTTGYVSAVNIRQKGSDSRRGTKPPRGPRRLTEPVCNRPRRFCYVSERKFDVGLKRADEDIERKDFKWTFLLEK